MSKQKIADLNRDVRNLENLLTDYERAKNESKSNVQRVRSRGLTDMGIYGSAIESILKSSDIYPIIRNGSPEYIQFEDFWKFAASDTPDYIRKIKEHISVLENEENSLDES